MATVALPTAGVSPTISMDWSRWRAHPLVMATLRVKDRFKRWHHVEPRTDVWVSFGALGLATAATLLAVAIFPLF